MKQIVILIFSSFIGLNGIAQIRKLDKDNIFSALYPGNNHFDNQDRLIRIVNRDGEEIEFRTASIQIFYYKTGSQQKAIVILFSYKYNKEENEVSSCHACHPEFEIAYFTYTTNSWAKQKFIQNWGESEGSWGEGAEVAFKVYNKVNCLALTHSYGNFEEFQSYTDYYSFENLKKINSIVK